MFLWRYVWLSTVTFIKIQTADYSSISHSLSHFLFACHWQHKMKFSSFTVKVSFQLCFPFGGDRQHSLSPPFNLAVLLFNFRLCSLNQTQVCYSIMAAWHQADLVFLWQNKTTQYYSSHYEKQRRFIVLTHSCSEVCNMSWVVLSQLWKIRFCVIIINPQLLWLCFMWGQFGQFYCPFLLTEAS